MANAKKLPSGKWRVLVFDYTDNTGKRHYKSFTADSRQEAELNAMRWTVEANKRITDNLTVSEAIDRYIAAKSGVLSPSTIRGYRQMQKNYYGAVNDIEIGKLTTETMQVFVSSVAMNRSPKSVSNIYGLLVSSVTMFRPEAVFKVTLPKKVRKKDPAPSDEDVRRLFQLADGELKVCIALAAFGSCRRGEICALKYRDVKGCTIDIHADMVLDEHDQYVYKDIPKTSDSLRTITVPEEVVRLIGKGEPNEFIVKATPGAVTGAFIRLRNKIGSGIRFHDLRHYYASVGAVLGVPDIYLSDFGGWRRGSGVMKSVYQSVMVSVSDGYANRMKEHFANLIQVQGE